MINRFFATLKFQDEPDIYFDVEAERDDAEYINDYLSRVPKGHAVSITIGAGGIFARQAIQIPRHLSRVDIKGGGPEGRVSIAHWEPRKTK